VKALCDNTLHLAAEAQVKKMYHLGERKHAAVRLALHLENESADPQLIT